MNDKDNKNKQGCNIWSCINKSICLLCNNAMTTIKRLCGCDDTKDSSGDETPHSKIEQEIDTTTPSDQKYQPTWPPAPAAKRKLIAKKKKQKVKKAINKSNKVLTKKPTKKVTKKIE